jgi:hypothetical protein
MRNLLLEELALSERIVCDGEEVVPRIRTIGPGAEFVVFVPLPGDLKARVRALGHIRQFMAWKGAIGFVMSVETWLGQGGLQDEDLRQGEAIACTAITRQEQLGVLRMINRRGSLSFGAPQWFGAESVDETLLRLLPGREEQISAEMMRELAHLFGAAGEFETRQVH